MRRKTSSSLVNYSKKKKNFNLLSNSDYDRDLVPAILDCDPLNKNKQGVLSKAVKTIQRIVPGGKTGNEGTSTPTPNQYSAPIGPTSKPDSSGVVSTPTGKVSTSPSSGGGGGSSNIFQDLANKNTYDSSTKTYTDSKGNKQSMASAPEGAKNIDSGFNKAQTISAQLDKKSINKNNQKEDFKAFVESEKAKDTLTSFEKKRKIEKAFNIPGRSENNPLTNAIFTTASSKTQSTKKPSLNEIEGLVNKGEVSTTDALFGKRKVIEITKQETYERDYRSAFDTQYKKEQAYLDAKSSEYQNRINAGESYDAVFGSYNQEVEAANQRLSEFDKGFYSNWQSSKGQDLDRYGGRVLFTSELSYNQKEVKGKLLGSFGKGAAVGAGVTGASMILGSFSKVGVKAVGAVGTGLAIGYGAYAYGKAGFKGRETYKEARELGFTRGESTQFALFSGATDIAPAAFGAAGATAGGFAVYGGTIGAKNLIQTGSIRGFTANDKSILSSLESRPNAYTQKLITGKVTDSNLARVGLSNGQVETLGIGKGGSSARAYDIELNMRGLTGQNKAVATKYNKAFTRTNVQVSNVKGKRVNVLEMTSTRYGRIFPRLESVSYSKFTGRTVNGQTTGVRQVFTQQKGSKYTDVSFERIISKGNVRYSGDLRGELSRGASVKFLQARYEGNKLIDFKQSQDILGSQSAIKSKFRGIEIEGEQVGTEYVIGKTAKVGRVYDIKASRVYQDIEGGSIGGKEFVNRISFTKTTPPKPYSDTSSGGGMFKLVSAQTSPKGSSTLPVSTSLKTQGLNNVVTSKGYGNSIYAGSSYGVASGFSSQFPNIAGGLNNFARGFSDYFNPTQTTSAQEQISPITGRVSQSLIQDISKPSVDFEFDRPISYDRNLIIQSLSKPASKSVAKSKVSPRQNLESSTKSIIDFSPKVNTVQGSKAKQKTLQRQLSKQKLTNVQEMMMPYPAIFTPARLGGFDFGLPPIPKGDFLGRMTKKKPQRKKQKTRYQTSLTGSILGIRGTGVAPGGLSVRGILDNSVKKPARIL